MTLEKYERNTVLTVRKAIRKDSGKYKLVLSNSSGTCEGLADVVVLGNLTNCHIPKNEFLIIEMFYL